MAEHSGISRPGLNGPLGNFLERFRRTGGVPAAVGGDLASELAPVFAALDEIERGAATLRERAEAVREGRKARLEQDVARILADGHRRAEKARKAAYEDARAAAAADAEGIVVEGERAAAGIRERGSSRLPGLVDEIVSRISVSGP